MINPNHNVKNFCKQGVIGGNSVPIMGNMVVDSGLLQVADIPIDIWQISDFASDLLILRLASPATVTSLLSLKNEDENAVFCNCFTLYFMRAHLFGVNAKKCNARHRVLLIWSSMLWFTSLKGVAMVTKRNIVCAAITMCFLVMQSDVPNPRYTTSEPNEHIFGMMRTIKREFTVNEMCDIVDKMWRQVRNLLTGALQKYRDPQKGYLATFDDFHGHVFSDEADTAGSVNVVDTDPGEVSQRIWDTLFPILNSVNEHMSLLLKNVFHVEDADISPFAAEFSENLKSILDRFLEYMARKTQAGTAADPEALQQDEDDSNTEDDDDDDKNTAVLTTVQEGLMKELIDAAAADHDEDEDDDVHADDHSNTGDDINGLVQQIYGDSENAIDDTAQNFAALVTCNQANKDT